MAEYTDADAVRAELDVDDEVLTDDAAERLIADAEDMVDEMLGIRRVDQDTGRKVLDTEIRDWQWDKLSRATAKLAAFLFKNPDWGLEQREVSQGSDIPVSGPYGSPFPAVSVLLNASGLRNLTTRASHSSGGPSPDSWIGNLPEPD